MTACAMMAFNNVSDDVWACITGAVGQYGVNITADAGVQTANGFTISWNYNRAAATLSIQCLDSPFWVSCSTINSHIHDVVESCLAQHQLQLGQMDHS